MVAQCFLWILAQTFVDAHKIFAQKFSNQMFHAVTRFNIRIRIRTLILVWVFKPRASWKWQHLFIHWLSDWSDFNIMTKHRCRANFHKWSCWASILYIIINMMLTSPSVIGIRRIPSLTNSFTVEQRMPSPLFLLWIMIEVVSICIIKHMLILIQMRKHIWCWC